MKWRGNPGGQIQVKKNEEMWTNENLLERWTIFRKKRLCYKPFIFFFLKNYSMALKIVYRNLLFTKCLPFFQKKNTFFFFYSLPLENQYNVTVRGVKGETRYTELSACILYVALINFKLSLSLRFCIKIAKKLFIHTLILHKNTKPKYSSSTSSC